VKTSRSVAGVGGQSVVRFTLTPPRASSIREADFIVTLDGKANRQGELYYRSPIAD